MPVIKKFVILRILNEKIWRELEKLNGRESRLLKKKSIQKFFK